MKLTRVLLLVTASVMLVACGSTASSAGGPVAAFKTTTVSGQPYVLDASVLERPTLLVFWASWCETCNEEAASVGALQARLEGRLDVVGVNVDEDRDAALEFVRRHKLVFPSVRDSDLVLADSLGVKSTPTLLLLAPGGSIVARGDGLEDVEIPINDIVGGEIP